MEIIKGEETRKEGGERRKEGGERGSEGELKAVQLKKDGTRVSPLKKRNRKRRKLNSEDARAKSGNEENGTTLRLKERKGRQIKKRGKRTLRNRRNGRSKRR